MATGIAIVTGASSGIGEATALHLRDLGFDVHAGVRRDADAERLSGLGLRPLTLDVSDPDAIAAAAASLDGQPVAALVNNAGIAVFAPLELVPIDQLRNQMEINFIGQVAVTQAFLPSLRSTRGRIVNVSSIGGRIALPLAGPYAASKFALEAVTDSLRRELRHLGVKVIAVEPGGVKTPIWDKGTETTDSMLAGAPPDVAQLYSGLGDALRAEARKIATETGVQPDEVAEVIGRALTSSRPRTRYLVGRGAKARAALARVLPDRVFDRLIARSLSS
ncbi:MAG TPA: SDR family NAD(P)-dependent oxidoreductase [Thermoleophilaceae bacterium]|nr:SDR family NAD(P)-dependent oxidoreductase [Thermoleophilaceae bacterium]